VIGDDEIPEFVPILEERRGERPRLDVDDGGSEPRSGQRHGELRVAGVARRDATGLAENHLEQCQEVALRR